MICVAFLLPFCAVGTAQTVPQKLDSLLRHTLDSMFNVLKPKGFSASVQLPNGAVWAGSAGISEENPTVEISTEHVFGIGSVHKTITAASILKFADAGILSLGDSLHAWLDTFNFINPNITIRQLLRHQSGIYDVITSPAYQPAINAVPDSIWAFDDVIKTFIKAPLFQPGAGWSYSNTNYLLLGMIIEKASGLPYFQEIRDQFLTPLALNSLVLPPWEAFTPKVAHLWLDLNGDGVVDDADIYFSDWNSWYSTAAPAGSYFSTPADMARWIRAYMSGTLLSPGMMAELKTTVSTNFPGGTKYGLGIMERNIQALKAWGHGGDAGYSASVWYFPAKDVSVVVLNNDGQKNSWSLIPTVAALLKTYIECEAQIVENQEVTSPVLGISTFPNPFLNEISVSMDLPKAVESARFALTDALGRAVCVFEKEKLAAGPQVLRFEKLSGLPSSTYFLTIDLAGKMAGRLVLVKKW